MNEINVSNLSALSDAQIKQFKENVELFKQYVDRVVNGKFTVNKSVCGFTIVAPINNINCTRLIFKGNTVAWIDDKGRFDIDSYNDKRWGKQKIKYDILCEIRDSYLNKEQDEDAVVKEVVVADKPIKKKRVYKKRKPNKKKSNGLTNN